MKYINYFEILKELNLKEFPENKFKYLNILTQNISKINCENKKNKTEYISSILREIINQINIEINIHNNEDYIYLFNDEQTKKISENIKWEIYENGYKLMNEIFKKRLYPWNNFSDNIYPKSCYCYFGNFGEEPKNEKELKEIYRKNLIKI